ncbi:trypsin-like peptidase [Prauserella shujinwangii]|uniref:Trypsin-like peptidase n=1 Tax=Prauserella shujinwangii TaxID=1453103 RepID=A0A2T0LYI0_9PSEU|nr:trypsin-like peptidase domain-containing protein [Prauserella shujinwangii]PRX49178.1 trypsin-like peptidase [Prauserella shujinwangii]
MTSQLTGLGEPRGPRFLPPAPPALAAVPPPPPGPAPLPPRGGERRRWPRYLGAGLLVVTVSAGTGALAGRAAAPEGGEVTFPRAAPAPGDQGGLVGVAERTRAGVVSITAPGGGRVAGGSGFVLDDRGHILTNDHIVSGADSVTVTGSDGRRVRAEIVGREPRADVAVLRIQPSPAVRPLPLGRSSNVRVGERVLAVGSPLGLAGTVTSGVVSAVEREVRLGGTEQTAVQTDASINPGNSGGPLVNARGEVIGVNTAIATDDGGGSIGIGFAIPVDRAADVAERLISGG